MEHMLGDEYADIIAKVWLLMSRDPKVRKIAETVRAQYEGADERTVAEEVLANMAENKVQRGVMNEVVAAVRRFLRGLGLRLPYSRVEVYSLLRRANRWLSSGAGAVARGTHPASDAIMFRIDGQATGPTAAQHRMKRFVDVLRSGKRRMPIDRVFRLLTAPAGGINPTTGEWRHAPRFQRAARKLVRETRPTGRMQWLDPVIETMRHGWLDRYGTPEEFIRREQRATVDKRRIEQEGVALVEALVDEELTVEEARALQDILEGADLNEERLSGLAEPIREALDKYGAEMVGYGLSREAYLRNLGTWLHRSYRRYETEGSRLQKWARKRGERRRASMQGDELRARGKRHPIAMKRLLRDVPMKDRKTARKSKRWHILDQAAPDGTVLRRVYWPENMPLPEEFFDRPGANAQWEARGLWDLLKVKGKKGTRLILRQDYTKEERAEMGEIRDARYNVMKSFQLLAHDIAQGRLFADIARNPAWFSGERPTEGKVVNAADITRENMLGLADVDWVRVPDTEIPDSPAKRWGAMAGGYLQAAIWRDLVELNKMQNPGFWAEVMRQYKLSKTARSPVVHFHNTVGNFMLMDMHDLGFSDFTRGMAEWLDRGEVYQEAVLQGVFGAGYVQQELEREKVAPIMKQILEEEARKDGPKTNMERGLDILRKIDAKMRGAYQFEDEIFRLASFTRDLDAGMAADEAGMRAKDRFFNYDIRAPWPNLVRKTALPFASYTYRFIPGALKALVARPWKLAKYFTLGYIIYKAAFLLSDGDEEEEYAAMSERDQGYTWAGLPRMFRTPFHDDKGDPIYIDLRRMLPGGGILNVHEGPTWMPEWLVIGGPLALLGEQIYNVELFSGDKITEEGDSWWEVSEKRLLHIWRSFMPNAPWVPFSWSWEMLSRAIREEEDVFGNTYSVSLAVIRQFGPKLKAINPENELIRRQMDYRRNRKVHTNRIWKLGYDLSRNRLSRAAYERQRAREIDRILDLERDMQERMQAFR